MRLHHRTILWLSALGVVAIAVAGCGGTAPAAKPPTKSTSAPSEQVAEGHALFQAKGCAACHGTNAEGTAIAPALASHTREQVVRQARSPVGTMPRFGPDQVSDAELELIAAYIVSLAPSRATPHHHP